MAPLIMAINSTPAIVLKSYDVRETSRLVVFYTRDFGKVTGIMKGIRTDPKKFGSSVDKFSLNDIVYYEYRNKDVHLISQCDMRQFYGNVRKDIKRMSAASYMLELVDKVMPGEYVNEDIFQLMLDYLEALQSEADINRLVHILQIKTLLYSGFRPHLDACVKTGQTISGRARFSMKLGGLIASEVDVQDDQMRYVSPGAVASILHIEKSDWQHCLRLKLADNIKEELKYILNNFLVFHLEKHIKSGQMLVG